MEINKINQGDALEVLKTFPDNSIDCCITSPPYWGLRNYGVIGQLGLEKTPNEYTAKLKNIFREVKRVLKKEGTCWLNLGDTYLGGGRECDTPKKKSNRGTQNMPKSIIPNCLKPKDIVGIPWHVAFALQADGWYLRQDIIWSKPNSIPESVTDRCTKSHEYIFLLAKSQKYYFDNEAIKEPLLESSIKRNQTGWHGNENRNFPQGKQNQIHKYLGSDKAKAAVNRNKRSVWTISTQPYKEAHFATFPKKLIEPMIKAGCPKEGIVLDPFIGSGTTALVARELERNYIGIELNPEYIKLCNKRLSQTFIWDDLASPKI